MNTKKTALNTAIILAVSASAVSFNNAYAGALAVSVVEVENFIISRGGTALDISDFGLLTFNSSADVIANLNGSANVALEETGNTTPSIGIDLFQTSGDLAATGYTDNDFSVMTANTAISVDPGAISGAPLANVSIGDQLEIGSPITGVDGIAVAGAHLGNAAYVSIDSSGVGSAQTNNGLAASWNFAGIGGVLDFDFNLRTYLEVFVEVGGVAPTFASANYAVNFDIVDLTNFGASVLIQSFSGNRSASSPLANDLPLISGATGWGNAFDGPISFSTANLDPLSNYELTFRISTTADALAVGVPAPGILAMLGLGFIGFASSRKLTVK